VFSFRIIALKKSGRQSDFVLALSLVLWLSLRDLVSLVPVGKLYLSKHSYLLIFFSPLSPLTAAAVVFGIMAGTLCNFATQLKFFAGYDDSLDVSVLLL
jgi:putative flippase GtrA